MNASKFLEPWLFYVLAKNTTIITDSKTAVEFYAKLYEIWLKDCQLITKDLLTNGGNE